MCWYIIIKRFGEKRPKCKILLCCTSFTHSHLLHLKETMRVSCYFYFGKGELNTKVIPLLYWVERWSDEVNWNGLVSLLPLGNPWKLGFDSKPQMQNGFAFQTNISNSCSVDKGKVKKMEIFNEGGGVSRAINIFFNLFC